MFPHVPTMLRPCFDQALQEVKRKSGIFGSEGTHSQQDGLGRIRRVSSTRFEAQWNSLCWEALGRCLENLGWEHSTVLFHVHALNQIKSI
jgi:hypothetical protein